MINNLQIKLFDWFMENFSHDTNGNKISNSMLIFQQLVGMIEEIGELAHSILKQEQKIRKNENHIEKIKDAIGDITIFSLNLISILHINFDDIELKKGKIKLINPLFSIMYLNLMVSNLIESMYIIDDEDDDNIEFIFNDELNKDNQNIIFAMAIIYEILDSIAKFYNLPDMQTIVIIDYCFLRRVKKELE